MGGSSLKEEHEHCIHCRGCRREIRQLYHLCNLEVQGHCTDMRSYEICSPDTSRRHIPFMPWGKANSSKTFWSLRSIPSHRDNGSHYRVDSQVLANEGQPCLLCASISRQGATYTGGVADRLAPPSVTAPQHSKSMSFVCFRLNSDVNHLYVWPVPSAVRNRGPEDASIPPGT